MTFNPLARQFVESWAGQMENKTVCELGNQTFTAGRDFPTTEAFYRSLGFSRYVALDVNSRFGSRIVDLNEVQGFSPEFGLVTNIGTGEHVFDQGAVFQNIHDLAKDWMLHILPFTPWFNHGFYNFNPVLFRDLAAANGYSLLGLWVANRWGETAELGPWGYEHKNPEQLRQAVASVEGETFICCVLRKTRGGGFRKPFQGKYVSAIESDALRQKYASS